MYFYMGTLYTRFFFFVVASVYSWFLDKKNGINHEKLCNFFSRISLWYELYLIIIFRRPRKLCYAEIARRKNRLRMPLPCTEKGDRAVNFVERISRVRRFMCIRNADRSGSANSKRAYDDGACLICGEGAVTILSVSPFLIPNAKKSNINKMQTARQDVSRSIIPREWRESELYVRHSCIVHQWMRHKSGLSVNLLIPDFEIRKFTFSIPKTEMSYCRFYNP